MSNVGRNDPCPCGSGKKYKQCCLGRATPASLPRPDAVKLCETGYAHFSRGELYEALSCFKSSILIKPSYVPAHYNIGTVYQTLGQLDDAVSSYRQTIALKRDHVQAYNNLGCVLSIKGEFEESVACFKKAIAIDPNFADAHHNLGTSFRSQGKLDDAIASFRKDLLLRPDNAGAFSDLLYLLQYSRITDEDLFNEHLRYGTKHTRAIAQQGFDTQSDSTADANRRLRIGYVSRDMGKHPVGYFLLPYLENHDPAQCEIFCYSERNRQNEDEMTASIKSHADFWRITAGRTNEEIAAMIRKDRIDILIDLAGHTAYNRLEVFCMKPAPIQMTWAGYVGTTGLPTMDYIISDARQTPPGVEDLYTEKIIRLPEDYVCYAPPAYAPPVAPLPMVENKHITFGCFNNLDKVTPEVIALWSKLLREIPNSRLVMKTRALDFTSTRERYRSMFVANGVDDSRVDMSGWAPHQELLATYNKIDVALDPFPYSGGLTTLESFWMGVPVITLEGTRFCSRHTLSHLHNVGLNELVASDADQYIAIARTLSVNADYLARLRDGLREKMANSPLCDGSRFARNMESTFRAAWQERQIIAK